MIRVLYYLVRYVRLIEIIFQDLGSLCRMYNAMHIRGLEKLDFNQHACFLTTSKA
jgi:hypothetical protein